MKKFALLGLLAAALAVPSIAAATVAPQGKLTGSASLLGPGTLVITTAVLDGGTDPLYVGKANDKSGNCSGDTGSVTFNGTLETVVCAHFIAASRDGSGPKMRFAFLDPSNASCYVTFRISDGGATDKVGAQDLCGGDPLASAQQVVNTGLVGAGFLVSSWEFPTVTGDYTVTASQT